MFHRKGVHSMWLNYIACSVPQHIQNDRWLYIMEVFPPQYIYSDIVNTHVYIIISGEVTPTQVIPCTRNTFPVIY